MIQSKWFFRTFQLTFIRRPQPDASGCQGESFGGFALQLIARHTETAKSGGLADSGPLFCYPLAHPMVLQAYN